MKKIILYLSCLVFISCDKEVTPTPVITPTCNISSETGVNNAYRLDYVYAANGLPEGVNISVKDNATGQLKATGKALYTYDNNRLVKVVDGDVEETIAYNANGSIARLVVTKTPEANYLNYTLNFTTDANQRISKVTDSKGLEATITRDTQGNILETVTKDTRTNQEVFKVVLSGYDNKKSMFEAYKGWQFSVLGYYAEYIKFPLYTTQAGGNATKRTEYESGKAVRETTYTYTYTTEGFPLTEQTLTRFLDGSGISTYSKTFTYTDCK